MSQDQQNIILTGATGNVGVHILYELLLKRLNNDVSGVIVVLVRANMKMSGQERIQLHLSHDCIPNSLKVYSLEQLMRPIRVEECSYHNHSVGSHMQKYADLESVTIIHSAATTNLASGDSSYKENYELNYKGSLNFYNAVRSFASKFIYISTAYSCGVRAGTIDDAYSKLVNPIFRNPYEEIKFKTERKLELLAEEDSISLQIMRPGVVVGRLSEHPSYFLPKFNVIYAFAAFFYSLKQKGIDTPIDISIGDETHLHLIPVDYVAKVIVKLMKNNSVKELNIIPAKGSTKNEVAEIMRVVGYDSYSFVKKYSEPRSKMEKIFQSRVADSFGKYIQGAYYEFDNQYLQSLTSDIPLLDVNDHFSGLISYARDNNFQRIE